MNHSLAEQILDLAQKSAVEAAEVYCATAQSQPVVFEANRLKQLESSTSEGMALRVWVEGRPGLAVAYGAVEPEILVAKAKAIAQLNSPEEIELYDGPCFEGEDPGHWFETSQLIPWGGEAIAQILDRYPDVLCGLTLECDRETTVLLNSRGFRGSYRSTGLSASLGVEWVRGEDFLGIYDDLDSQGATLPDCQTLLDRIFAHLTWAQDHAPAPLGSMPVLFTPKAATLLWEVLEEAMSGKACLEGASPWSQRRGDRLLAPNLTLRQDPQAGDDYCPMDDEGMATQALTLINQGIFERMYCDRRVGRQLSQASTGNGFRGSLGRYPSPGLVNLIITPGSHSVGELVGMIPNGLVVDQILGGGGDLSGDFAINVDLGYRIDHGELIGRVKDTMIAGNIYNALNRPVVLGSDLRWVGNYLTPSVLVEGLSIVSDDGD
ncbi:MAG: TldD/PmbA family protein [Spirulina sp. DLM2.Bin59]|nr:MAG: TldD/PmbA family protein [Spirulina sp. DLM2.Bin59]